MEEMIEGSEGEADLAAATDGAIEKGQGQERGVRGIAVSPVTGAGAPAVEA